MISFNVSNRVVHLKLPQRDPCISTLFTVILFVSWWLILTATLACSFSLYNRFNILFVMSASYREFVVACSHNLSKHFTASCNWTCIGASPPFITEFVTAPSTEMLSQIFCCFQAPTFPSVRLSSIV